MSPEEIDRPLSEDEALDGRSGIVYRWSGLMKLGEMGIHFELVVDHQLVGLIFQEIQIRLRMQKYSDLCLHGDGEVGTEVAAGVEVEVALHDEHLLYHHDHLEEQ